MRDPRQTHCGNFHALSRRLLGMFVDEPVRDFGREPIDATRAAPLSRDPSLPPAL